MDQDKLEEVKQNSIELTKVIIQSINRVEDKCEVIMRDTAELKAQQARDSVILVTHEKRSTNLEKQVKALNKFMYLALGGWGLLVILAEVWKSFH